MTQEQRALTMARMYAEDGLTMTQIGEQYGITRQRVEQIIRPFELEAHYGRRSKEARARRLREAHTHIAEGQATWDEEVERLGYASKGSLSEAFSSLGLLMPKRTPAAHGSVGRYRRGCRCHLCRQANAAYQRARRGKSNDPPSHGVSGYFNYGCRCEICRTEASIYQRERRTQPIRDARAEQ